MSEISLEKLAKEFTEFKSKKKSKHYPEQLKQQALKLAKDGMPIKQLCEELGVHVTTFCYWRRAAQNIKPFTKANIVESSLAPTLTVVTGVPIHQLGTVIKQLP